MKDFIRECIWFIATLLLVSIHLSLLQTLLLFSPIIHLVVLASLVLCIVGRPYRALEVGVLGGYVLDLFSGFPFGIFLISICISIGVMLMLQIYVFKNKALHAVALNTTIATAVFHLSWITGVFLMNQLSAADYSIPYQHVLTLAGIQILVHVVVAALIVTLIDWINAHGAKSV